MKNLNLKNEFEKIIQKNHYFLKFNRVKKISYKNYYSNTKDPDGKKRDLLNEEKYKISQMKIVLDFLNKRLPIKQRKILDIGCGFGWLLKNLKEKYWKKYGIEINEEAKNIAKKNKIKVFDNLIFLKNKKFDVVSMIHVIEHLRNPINDLKKIKKNIKRKGYLIIETPDFDSAMARKYNKKFRLLHDKTHISLFSAESLMRLVRNLGFQIIKVEYPYFEGPFFNKKNILKLFKKNSREFSPPFYGSVVTIFAKKK